MYLDANSGKIVGKARNTGSFKFTVEATDASGVSVTKQYTIIVGQSEHAVKDRPLEALSQKMS